jgi:hypothetical protein
MYGMGVSLIQNNNPTGPMKGFKLVLVMKAAKVPNMSIPPANFSIP